MKYKNTKTGAVIDSPCKIAGGDWVKYTDEVKESLNAVKETPEEVIEEKAQDNAQGNTKDGVTKKQIMQELDAMGVEYDPKALKGELYNLMIKG